MQVFHASEADKQRADFRNRWRVVLTADEVYAARDAAKKETK